MRNARARATARVRPYLLVILVVALDEVAVGLAPRHPFQGGVLGSVAQDLCDPPAVLTYEQPFLTALGVAHGPDTAAAELGPQHAPFVGPPGDHGPFQGGVMEQLTHFTPSSGNDLGSFRALPPPDLGKRAVVREARLLTSFGIRLSKPMFRKVEFAINPRVGTRCRQGQEDAHLAHVHLAPATVMVAAGTGTVIVPLLVRTFIFAVWASSRLARRTWPFQRLALARRARGNMILSTGLWRIEG